MAGFIGAMTATLLFGFSTSFVSALLSRGLAGALSGNVAVLLSAVGEITDETNQAQAYAIFGVANNLAQIAGPSIGCVTCCSNFSHFHILTPKTQEEPSLIRILHFHIRLVDSLFSKHSLTHYPASYLHYLHSFRPWAARLSLKR